MIICRRIVPVAALALLSATSGPPAHAQHISLAATRMDANHELLGEPLLGGAGRVALRFGALPVSVHIGAERATGSAWRTAVMCEGLVDPELDNCHPEVVNDRAEVSGFSGGIGLALLDFERLKLTAMLSRHIATVSARTRGQTTGRRRSNSETHTGPEAGIDVAWSPWRSVPVALEIGLTTGNLKGRGEPIVDGYSPFTETFSINRLHVAAVWHPRRR